LAKPFHFWISSSNAIRYEGTVFPIFEAFLAVGENNKIVDKVLNYAQDDYPEQGREK
jgi:hypothetical protein